MKRLFIVVLLFGMPTIACAELPLERFFLRTAEHAGIPRETFHDVVSFAQSLQDDMLVECSVVSFAPPMLSIRFASGKAIHADGTTLQLIEGTERTIDAEAVCPVLVLLSALLLWAGIFLLSLPLFVAGLEFIVITGIICL